MILYVVVAIIVGSIALKFFYDKVKPLCKSPKTFADVQQDINQMKMQASIKSRGECNLEGFEEPLLQGQGQVGGNWRSLATNLTDDADFRDAGDEAAGLAGDMMNSAVPEAIQVGVFHYKFGLMHNWSVPMLRYQYYDFLVDVHLKNVMGVGLAAFYDFHLLPFTLGIGLYIVTRHAANSSHYMAAVDLTSNPSYEWDGTSINNYTAYKENIVTTGKDFGESLVWGLFYLWVAMVLFSWVWGHISAQFANIFDELNSTMNDYVVQLSNLPKDISDIRYGTTKEDHVTEDILLQKVNQSIGECGAKAIGCSIGYDIRERWEVFEMVERIVVEKDVEMYVKEKAVRYVQKTLKQLIPNLDNTLQAVNLLERKPNVWDFGQEYDEIIKEKIKLTMCCTYNKSPGKEFVDGLPMYYDEQCTERDPYLAIPWNTEFLAYGPTDGASVMLKVPKDGKYGWNPPAFGCPEMLAGDFTEDLEEAKNDPCARRHVDMEKAALLKILDGDKDAVDAKRKAGLKTGQKAFIVFENKADAFSVINTFKSIWMRDEVAYKEVQRSLWTEALTADASNAYEKKSMNRLWTSGQGTLKQNVELDTLGEVMIPAGTHVELKKVIRKNKESGKVEECNIQEFATTTKLGDLQDGDMLILYRKVDVSACEAEPPTVMWDAIGTPNSVKLGRSIKAVAVTLVVFGLIVALAYTPFGKYINLPYAKAEESPKDFTNNTQGFLIGIANGILGAVMGMFSYGVGFEFRWELDIWVSAFNTVVCLFNSAYSIFITFDSAIQDESEGKYVAIGTPHHHHDLNGTQLRQAVTQEIHTSYMLYTMLVPGWLFIGFIVGNLVGLIVPWIQNGALVEIVFYCRCLPKWLNDILIMIIPFNPQNMNWKGEQRKELTARKAEQVFAPGETNLAWEYADRIINPLLCMVSLFFLSPHMWCIFPQLTAWAAFMYLCHRFALIRTRKKCVHDSTTLSDFNLYLWSLPVSTILAASAFWAVRLGMLGSYILPVVAFFASMLFYCIGLYIVLPGPNPDILEKEKDYEYTKSILLYTWYNCNPVHVLKSAYGFLGVRKTTELTKPLEKGMTFMWVKDADKWFDCGYVTITHKDKPDVKTTFKLKGFVDKHINPQKCVIGLDNFQTHDETFPQGSEVLYESQACRTHSDVPFQFGKEYLVVEGEHPRQNEDIWKQRKIAEKKDREELQKTTKTVTRKWGRAYWFTIFSVLGIFFARNNTDVGHDMTKMVM